jgi:hypothetical protein
MSVALSAELIEAARSRLYSAVISDVLDSLGDTEHAMRPNVRPLDENLVLFGRARTALYMEVYHVEDGPFHTRVMEDLAQSIFCFALHTRQRL